MRGYQGHPDSPGQAHQPYGSRKGIIRVTDLVVFSLAMLIFLRFASALYLYRIYFITLLVVFIAVFIAYALNKGWKLYISKLDLAVLALFSLPLISTLWSISPTDTLSRGLFASFGFLLYYMYTRFINHDMTEAMTRISRMNILSLLLLSMMIFMVFGTLRANSYESKQVIGSVSNGIPAVIVICVPYMMREFSLSRHKLFYTGVLLLALFIAVLSESRGGMLLIVVAIALSYVISPENLEKKVVNIFVLGVLPAILLFFVISAGAQAEFFINTWERIQSSQLLSAGISEVPRRDQADFERAVMYHEGFKIVSGLPLLGVGFGGLHVITERLYGDGIISHNLVITAWGELGIAGMLVVTFLFGTLLYRLYVLQGDRTINLRLRYDAAATIVALVVLLMHAQFRPFYSNPMIPIVLAHAVMLVQSYARRRRSV